MAAPKGHSFASAEHRMLTAALKRKLAEKAAKGGLPAAVRIANKVVEKALDGERWACELAFDRTEGKAVQAVTLSGDEDAPPVSINIKGA